MKITTRNALRFALLALTTLTLASGSRSASAAGLLVADGGLGGTLEIKEHSVRVTINNGVAVTEVEQVFLNKENRPVEALYTFPVPRRASVANFSMWINGKEMIGEVLEKQRARQIYESYKTVKRDPGLLEQVDFKRFEMRIFPIAAGAEQRVRLTYYQELDFDHDEATYVYPLATKADARADSRTTGKFAFTLETKSEVPIVTLESPSHERDLVSVRHTPHLYQASLETNGGRLDRDIVVALRVERPRTGMDLVVSKQPGEDGYFLMTLTAGKDLAESDIGMDYVFVTDISGSMAHDGKLALSRDAVAAFFEALGPKDRLELMAFHVAPVPLFRQLEPATDEAKTRANEFLANQRAQGGTELRPALQTAYKYADTDRILNVVVLSDGMTEPREQQQLLSLIRERPRGARVFCIGVGNEVNRPLLQQVADQAGGLAAFVSRDDNLERQARAFRRKLVRPAATNVQLQFAGAETYDVEPRTLPPLYFGAPLRVYGRYKSSGPTKVTVKAEILGQPFEDVSELSFAAEDDRNPQIERMWAAHRVDRLFAEERETTAGRHRDEIVRLCEGYSITSEYASFLVLENDAEYQRWKIDRRNVTRATRDRAAQERVRQEFAKLREQALSNLGPTSGAPSQPTNASTPATTPSSPPTTAPAPDTALPTLAPTSSPPAPANRSDWQLPTMGGGGAIDPFSGLVALAVAGASLAATRRRTKGRR